MHRPLIPIIIIWFGCAWPPPAGMAGFYRLIAYAVPSMIVANATGGLVSRQAPQPAKQLAAGCLLHPRAACCPGVVQFL